MIKEINKKVVTKHYVFIFCLAMLMALKFNLYLLIMSFGVYIFNYRYDFIPLMGVNRLRISKKENTKIFDSEKWFDDYFTVEYINEKTIIIGEPRYWQRNYSYLIIGQKEALLFDCGSGYRDITKVVEKLTDLPIRLMISHYHYDHIGYIEKFDSVFISNNQLKNQQIKEGNIICVNQKSYLGKIEGLKQKSFSFEKLCDNKEIINLGNREIQVLFSPGHDEESISLYDISRNILYAGDFLLKGPLIAHKSIIKGSNIIDYKFGVKNVCESINEETIIYMSHPSDFSSKVIYGHDLFELDKFLDSVNENNKIPKKKKITDNISIMY